jgi:Alginate lyase
MLPLLSAMSTALSVIVIVLPGPPGSTSAQPSAQSGSSVLPPVNLPSAPSVGLDQPQSTGDAATNRGGNGLLGGAVDLAGYKLTIPEVSDKGTAASVDNPSQGKPPWMTKAPDGSLRFWAPVAGATTPNSQHARTELVSLKTFTAGAGRHTLRTSLMVSQVPRSKRDIIIGQIHGAGDINSVSFVMLHYDAGTIKAVVKQGQSGPTSNKYPLVSGVPLGGRFDYTISDTGDGNVVCTATSGSTTRSATIPIPAAFKGATVRFQAGDYQQADSTGSASKDADSSGADSSDISSAAAGSSGQDGGRVTFFSLTEDHTGDTS